MTNEKRLIIRIPTSIYEAVKKEGNMSEYIRVLILKAILKKKSKK